ncbi:transcriptional repressor [Periweissella fabaria]|uniref:Zinc-specific metallo-regulatory protein n=1 Tax=Periweissella fabaria TaxID=546157 RepID=A0ABM8Z3W6_9LACO|nr:Fur family transcriptional regulator [Periweissella fabaria]MCM0596398.1 transcriptional repressor [Periweissella fabaria]CAH0415874.1 Zinc-specific metallo-regulatory protein [Periweissella fabaria]
MNLTTEIDVEQAIQIMKKGGLKATKQRLALLQLLFAKKDFYQTLAELTKQMREQFTKMSNETVYRNVKELEQLQIVETRLFDNGIRAKFQCDFNNTTHAHFICEQCGRIMEIAQPDISAILAQLPGYVIEQEHFELVGTCPSCQLKASN